MFPLRPARKRTILPAPRPHHHPVSGDGLAIGAGESHIDQGVGVEQVLERGQRVETVIIPLQVELLRRLHGGGIWNSCRFWGLALIFFLVKQRAAGAITANSDSPLAIRLQNACIRCLGRDCCRGIGSGRG